MKNENMDLKNKLIITYYLKSFLNLSYIIKLFYKIYLFI